MEYKLGKLATKTDKRTFKLRALLNKKLLPPLPKEFSVDSSNFGNPMFANDRYQCCVISGRAHITLRFEKFEQNKLIQISDNDVIGAYLYESKGADNGLYMLDSLKIWRKQGWWADGKAYNIYAFAQLNVKQHNDCKYAVYLFNGAYVGLSLPLSAKNQTTWDIVPDTDPEGEFGSWGGHCVYINKYNEVGPICVTWGREQQMTWAFWDRYCDEAYAVIDNRDTFIDPTVNPLNCEKLISLLQEVSTILPEPPNPNPPNPPNPSPVPWYEGIVQFFQSIWKTIQGWFTKK